MNPTNDNSLNQVLSQLEKFGFKFFGYSEAKEPLVIAPNGQVISVTVAYNFMQSQIAKASSGGGIETMPTMPNIPQLPSPESKVETAPENIERKPEDNQSFNLPTIKTPAPVVTPPKMSMDKSTGTSPFGDGFAISSFDPTDVDQTVKYVEANSKANNTTSKKWLAIQLEKFLAETRSKGN